MRDHHAVTPPQKKRQICANYTGRPLKVGKYGNPLKKKITSLLDENDLFYKEAAIGYSRLIDDSDHVQTGDGSCIFGGLALGIIEISGHSDHSMCDL